MITRSLLALILSAPIVASHATEYVKETTLLWVGAQATRPIQTSTQNTVFVSLPTGTGAQTWSVNGGSGGPACSEGAAYLPADSMVRAIALAAISSGATVQIAVDNTLPMLGAYCQVTMLTVKNN